MVLWALETYQRAAIQLASSAKSNLTKDAVEKIVASALNRVVGAPKVEVFNSLSDAGLPVSGGVIPKGETLPQGRIISFVNDAESVVDVYRTLFHGVPSYRLSRH